MVLKARLQGLIKGQTLRVIGVCALAAFANACSTGGSYQNVNGQQWGAPKYGPTGSASAQNQRRGNQQTTDWQRVARQNNQNTGHQKIGRPYTIAGKTYVPARDDQYDRTGIASWYGPNFHGKPTANGETFDQNALTAAHPTLPIPSVVRVTNLDNGKEILVRVNDRGPFVDDRMIDLSKRAASDLGYRINGTARVRVQYIGPAPLKANSLPVAQASATPRSMPRPQPAVTRSVPKPAPAQPAVDENGWPEDPKLKYKVALSRPRTSASGWFVQAGAYSSKQKAQAIANAMQVGSPPIVQEAWVSNRTIYRVLVGPFASRPQAATSQQAVVNAGFAKARITEQN